MTLTNWLVTIQLLMKTNSTLGLERHTHAGIDLHAIRLFCLTNELCLPTYLPSLGLLPNY